MSDRRSMLVSAALVGILALCAALYWPGLSGAFLFDDQANLAKLQKIASPLTWEQLAVFASSGTAGPLGRPLAMLTFGLQYQAWPADPEAFRLANLFLHLANGMLVFWLLAALGKVSGWKVQGDMFALFVAAAWLLHPIQVSTTLYIVQRMTMLATFFTLAGLIAFVKGRCLVQQGKGREGYLLAGGGIVLGTILALAGKESGILLPLYALIVEVTLFSAAPMGEGWKKWKAIFLYLPLLAAFAILLVKFGTPALYQGRDFTLSERLLTEPRVTMDYLRKLFLVPPYNFGVFFDDYLLSKGWMSPPQTLVAIVAVAMLLGSAWWMRRRFPYYAFAVLWFFAGHILESTALPLELYFEHRNYLPSLGPIAGVILGISGLAMHRPLPARKIYGLVAAAIFLSMVALTWQQTRLWGNSLVQSVIWTKEHPASQRAVERAGMMFALAGDAEKAEQYFAALGQRFPAKADGPMFQLYLNCYFPDARKSDVDELKERMKQGSKSTTAVSVLGEIVRLKEQGRCERVADMEVKELLAAAIGNPNYQELNANLWVLRGRIGAAEKDFLAAVTALDGAYDIAPNKEVAFQQMVWAEAAGMPELAREYAERTRKSTTGNSLHDKLIDRQLMQRR